MTECKSSMSSTAEKGAWDTAAGGSTADAAATEGAAEAEEDAAAGWIVNASMCVSIALSLMAAHVVCTVAQCACVSEYEPNGAQRRSDSTVCVLACPLCLYAVARSRTVVCC